ncbi:DgyrCDS8004 [Dimorphilus gyrociliatus]|uniref:DgyrCDS8004 n=1 Tax=Dimorphilus gyrociliatus TaxID=2664684 RepID=A0A7I8VUJ9_9ANNE|nr:DgyrCDS8004 [Dimorphilus gyrociliatus]
MDSSFPPDIIPQTPGSVIPTGHLRPIGWQRRPEAPLKERVDFPSPREFYNEYVTKNIPVVFRQAMKDAPAITKWESDDYLKKEYGNLLVHVTVKKERAKQMDNKKVTFRQFLKEYQYEDWYLSNIVPQMMTLDLTLPKIMRCGFTKYLLESGLWMSSGGTSSLIHSHADHNLHCLLAGRKDFTVIEEKYKEMLQYVNKEPHHGAGYSNLDVDMINMFKNKDIKKVPWTWATLRAGDCVFIPARYIHQVRSWGRSISSTILFSPTPTLSFSDCNRVELSDEVLLSDATFMWTYINGDRQLSNSKLNAASLRHHLIVLMRERGQLKKSIFDDFFKEVMKQSKRQEISTSEVWKLLKPGKRKSIPRSEIEALSDEDLTKVADILNVLDIKKDEL